MNSERRPRAFDGRSPLRWALLCWPCALCCVVAARQFWAATERSLSPWKGGGFGMFATTDNPSARVVHCAGVTAEGEEVVVRFGSLPPGARLSPGVLRRLQTYPTQQDLDELVRTLAQLEYVHADTSSVYLHNSLLAQNPVLGERVPAPRLWPVRVVTAKDERRAGHRSAQVVRLARVEASAWRVRFAVSDHSLRVELMLPPVHADNPTVGGTAASLEAGEP